VHFVPPFPLWVAIGLAAALLALAYFAYRRPLAPLTPGQKRMLTALRLAALLLLLVFLLRPIVMRPPAQTGEAVVAILVDTSRSMAIRDGGSRSRLEQAVDAVSRLVPALGTHFSTDVLRAGDLVAPAPLTSLAADANRSDLQGAVAAVLDRYRGRRIAGVVLISDGGDTGHDGPLADPSVPVFTLGVGSASGAPDREVTAVTAGDPKLDHASVDLRVVATSRGYGRKPFTIQLSAGDHVVDSRQVVPAVDGAPVDVTFTVSPDASTGTVYAAAIAPEPGEATTGNNARSVFISPRGRKRRVLMLEGAPGFEHSFLSRALAEDSDLDIDAAVRKGANDAGQSTFLVQAPSSRAATLATGFPGSREALFSYDAVIAANESADTLSTAQLAALADFVALRGGGLLALGGVTFSGRGLIGTPLEAVLPVELGDRRGAVRRTSQGAELAGPRGIVVPTPEGATHPAMRIGESPDETRKKWSALPPLPSSAALGAPRAGATVLATASIAGGAIYPIVAVQPYGLGRSMIFGGEASWRWRMMMPVTDRSYERFWRQAVRWLAAPTPDPVSVIVPEAAQPGEDVTIAADVRDAAFAPISDATIDATVVGPDKAAHAITFRRDISREGRFVTSFRPDVKGVYALHALASRRGATIGASERAFYAGGADPELADPRLNENVLRRIAQSSGGRYAPIGDAAHVAEWIEDAAPQSSELEPRDAWQQPWLLALVIGLLAAEWILRRRWGLR
jgi:uncharacterized membrane protein